MEHHIRTLVLTSTQAAAMVENDRTVVIDASTAFRVDDDWTYGFPGTRYILYAVYITHTYTLRNVFVSSCK